MKIKVSFSIMEAKDLGPEATPEQIQKQLKEMFYKVCEDWIVFKKEPQIEFE